MTDHSVISLEGSRLFDLPIAVYEARLDGTFVHGNRRLRKLLQLPESGSLEGYSITSFYTHQEDRQRLMELTERAEASGQYIEKKTVSFTIGRRQRYLQMSCRRSPHQDPPTYLGCLVDVTEEEELRQLVEQLPSGIYQANADNRLETVNPAMAEMLGYDGTADLEGQDFGVLFRNPEDGAALAELLRQTGSQRHAVQHFARADGVELPVSLNTTARYGSEDEWIGHQGTVESLGERLLMRELIRETPLGLYKVKIDGERHRIVHCNDSFARIFDYQWARDVEGLDIRELHEIDDQYSNYLAALEECCQRGQPLLGHILKTRTRKRGRSLSLEVNCRLLVDPDDGRQLGRIGVLRDVSEEARARRRLGNLTADIGNVLHSYETMLVNLRSAFKPLRQTLGVAIREPIPTDVQPLFERLHEVAGEMAESLGHLAELAREPGRAAQIGDAERHDLERLGGLLGHYRERIPLEEQQAATLHLAGLEIEQLGHRLRSLPLPDERVRHLSSEGWRLARLASLLFLARVEDSVLHMDYQVRSLREYVTQDIRQQEEAEVLSVDELLRNSMSNLTELARYRRISVRPIGPLRDTFVEVPPNTMVRALTNLLHNAIKYSWVSEGEKGWVRVRCRIDHDSGSGGGDMVAIEIENHGVAIPRSELESESLFGTGVRGRMSKDRGRIGTGIGLGDARDIARAAGGDVVLDSKPARPGIAADNYSRPFLTTATLRLPLRGDDEP